MTNSERREYNIRRTVDSALECFQELGIEATTQAVIAKKVRLTTKTIQRYFSSKDEIVLLAMKRLNERYYELIERQLERLDLSSMTGLDELLAFFAAHEVFFDPKNRILLLMTEMHMYLIRHNIGESRIFMMINAAPPQYKRIIRSLEKGVNDGSIRKNLDIKLAYAVITSSFAGMIQRMMMMPETYDSNHDGVDKNDILTCYIKKARADLQPE